MGSWNKKGEQDKRSWGLQRAGISCERDYIPVDTMYCKTLSVALNEKSNDLNPRKKKERKRSQHGGTRLKLM